MKKSAKKATIILTMITILLLVLQISSAQIIDSPSLEATLAYQDPDPVEPGEEAEFRFSIKNTGSSPAKSAEFRILTTYPFEIAPGESDAKSVGDIKVYDAREIDTGEVAIKMKLVVDDEALEGDYLLELQYKTEGGTSKGEWTELETFSAQVGSSASFLIIEESASTPEEIRPGESAEVTLTIANQGNSNIEDITVTADLSDLPELSPLKTSNEVIIKRLAPGASEQATFSFIVAPDAAIQIYKLPIKLEYRDERDNVLEKTSIISLVINAQPEYVLNLEESKVFKAKESGNVVISLSNIGLSDINYATLSLEPSEQYTIISADTVYLGNLESDDFETAQFMIYTEEYAPEIPLKFTLRYKDKYNKNYEDSAALNMKVFTGKEAKQYGLTSGGWGITPFFLIIAIGVGVWYWRKKKKAQNLKK